MPQGYTFAMIKPSAYQKNHVGPILAMINQAGFRISAIRSTKLTKQEAEIFYQMHKGKPFYNKLCNFMSSGPIIALLLEKENAIEDFRKLIGNTNPAIAEEGTIRKIFADICCKKMPFMEPTPSKMQYEKLISFLINVNDIPNFQTTHSSLGNCFRFNVGR